MNDTRSAAIALEEHPRSLPRLSTPVAHVRTAHEYVRSALRQAIISGDLAGGTRLVQSEIAAELQVSTTPVREALRDLATENLIHLDAHRGAVVREIELEEVRTVYEARRLLEPLALARAVNNVDEAALLRLEVLADQMEREEDPARWTTMNREFHGVLNDATDSPLFSSILRSLTDAAERFVGVAVRAQPGLRKVGHHQHRALIRAVRAGDSEDAAAIAQEHLRTSLNAIEEAVQSGTLRDQLA